MSDRDEHKMRGPDFEALEAEGKRIEDESWEGASENLKTWRKKLDLKSESTAEGGEQYLLDFGEESRGNLK